MQAARAPRAAGAKAGGSPIGPAQQPPRLRVRLGGLASGPRLLLVWCLLTGACLTGACLAGACLAAEGADFVDRPEWARHFADAGTQGTFLLYDLRHDRYQVTNRSRAEQRFSPASTFKIANALIALDLGVVADERQVFPWDGTRRDLEPWNRDHTLRTAMRYSVVPVFQGIARQIGAQRMQEYLTRLAYGNSDISDGVDRFWLDGSLQISPLEQVQFLVRLYQNALPVQERSQRVVQEILLNEASPAYILRAKTGWGTKAEPAVGWWIGWVEREEDTWFFALSMEVRSPDQLGARISIAKAILRSEGILPPEPGSAKP